MKIAVCLIGLANLNTGTKQRDWQMCCENILSTFGNVSYFISAYDDTEHIEEMLDIYKPVKHQFLPRTFSQRAIYIEALKQVSDADFVITTRFDIHVKVNIEKFNMSPNNFNFLFKEKHNWHEERKFVTDNFFAFPLEFKNIFKIAIQRLEYHPLKKQFMHHVYGPVSNMAPVHFISETHEASNDNSFYKLIRKNPL